MKLIDQLSEKVKLYSENKIEYSELKDVSSKLGIYRQKDGKFMSRIRIPGGEVETNKLKKMNSLAKRGKADFIHFTTRADIQIHGIDVFNLHDLLSEFQKNDFHFIGGGGNCVRAATASSHSGLISTSLFDVVPYAQALENAFEDSEKTSLPRKIKIGFSCCSEDCDNTKYQDIGFVAKLSEGRRYFDVYVGGTLGKTPFCGIKILSSIDTHKYLNVVSSVIRLFHDHGNYNDKSKARIKFLLESKGEDEFRKLFMSYYELHDKFQKFEISKKSIFASLPVRQITSLFIPYGNLSSDELDELISLFDEFKVSYFRITRERNILIKLPDETIFEFHSKLKDLKRNYTGTSFKGLITSCVGAKVCDVGIIDSPRFADIAAEYLDEFFVDKPILKKEFFTEILKSIKFSGCPNSCGYNKLARLGFSGVKSKNNYGEFNEMCKFSTINNQFSYSEDLRNKPISDKEIRQLTSELISNIIKKRVSK